MYNKNLSRLEAIYQVSSPVLEEVEPDELATYLETVIFDPEESQFESIDWEYFREMVNSDTESAKKVITTVLMESEHLISRKSINASIDLIKSKE